MHVNRHEFHFPSSTKDNFTCNINNLEWQFLKTPICQFTQLQNFWETVTDWRIIKYHVQTTDINRLNRRIPTQKSFQANSNLAKRKSFFIFIFGLVFAYFGIRIGRKNLLFRFHFDRWWSIIAKSKIVCPQLIKWKALIQSKKCISLVRRE